MIKKLNYSNFLIIISFVVCLLFLIFSFSFNTLCVCISTIFGILASKNAKDGKWQAFIFDILSSALYLNACLNNKYYGEFILSVLIIMFNVICLKEWKKNTTNNFVKISDVCYKEIRFIGFVGIILLSVYAIILTKLNTAFALFNAICTISFILGNYFCFRRSVIQFYCLVTYEIFFITLWCISAFSGNFISILFIFGGTFELLYDILGIIKWKNIATHQKNKKCKVFFLMN